MKTALPATLYPLREKVRANALNRPGVYRMMAASGVVIYVGKSKRIRTRLMGYFRSRREEKAWRIVREAKELDWEYTSNEFASLLKELQLIKRFRPPYNVQQKRDGLYSFLRITHGPAPKLQVVRRVTDDAGSYYGPFRGGQRIVDAVRELNDVLQLRDCRTATPIRFADQEDLFRIESNPLCARYELRRCAGPCAALCTERGYDSRIEQARRFLFGDADGPLRELAVRMDDAAARLEFEHAASLRDRVGRLEMLRSEFQRLRETVEGLSFLYAVPGFERDHRIYAIRSGSIRAEYSAPATRRARARLAESAAEHYGRPEGPADITSRNRVEEILLIAHWFRTRPGERARTFAPGNYESLPLRAELDAMTMA